VLNRPIRQVDPVQLGPAFCETLMIGPQSHADLEDPLPPRSGKSAKGMI
jgi:hypothetical protein